MRNEYQTAKIASIVTNEGLARLEAAKRREQLGRVNHDKRDWVNVPYEQKDLAKRVGCRWCPVVKKWYASSYMSSRAVEAWLEEQADKKAKRK